MEKLPGHLVKSEPQARPISDKNALQIFADNSKDLMWEVDQNLNVVISNRKFDETLGKILSDSDLVGGEDLLRRKLHFTMNYEKALTGKSFIATDYYEKPVEGWLEVSYGPVITNHEITGVCCVGRDSTMINTEIKRLKLLESVVTNATDAILIAEAASDEAGPKIVYTNDALLRITGYAKEEIIGMNPNVLIGAKSDQNQLDQLKTCFERSEPCEIEIINYKKNGGEFWIHMSMAPVANHGGSLTHYIAIGRDVTERVKNTDAIRQQNLKLSEIARVQSHEVRGPLARIKGLINLLSSHSNTLDSKSATEIMKYLKFSSNEMDAVIAKIILQTDDVILSGQELRQESAGESSW